MLVKQHPDNSVVKPKHGIPTLPQSIRLIKSADPLSQNLLFNNAQLLEQKQRHVPQPKRFSCFLIFTTFYELLCQK